MNVQKTRILLPVLALALAWALPAEADTAAARFCAQGTSPTVEIALGTPDWQPQQTCGPCLIDFCPVVGVRCTLSGCGLNNCCAYFCDCDETCTNTGTPGNTCALSIPNDCNCGNGTIDPPEECDGSDFGGATCASFGFESGTLVCTPQCIIDTSGCYTCGNLTAEGPEDCDYPDLRGQTCASFGFASGTLGCTSICTFDISGCYTCGNGTAEGPEDCDYPDLRGQTCMSLGFEGGTLSCDTLTCLFDTSECFTCPNGVCEGPENCNTCPEDCDSKTTGPRSGRFCCGNEIGEPAEGADCSVCDGNC